MPKGREMGEMLVMYKLNGKGKGSVQWCAVRIFEISRFSVGTKFQAMGD